MKLNRIRIKLYNNRYLIDRYRFWLLIAVYLFANSLAELTTAAHCTFLVLAMYCIKYLRRKN